MAVTVKGKGKHVSRARRHFRLRKKVAGTPERPRLVVSRSNRHMMAQIIDDSVGHTLVSASTLESGLRGLAGNKVDKSVFDRGGNKYHGRVAAVAEGARSAGLTL